MSINLALIPVGIVMYAVMGEKKFNEFVSKNEIVKYTKFKSLKELEEIVNSIGYDFKEHFGILKNHYKNGDYFTWEVREDCICAIFYVQDEKDEINKFMGQLELKLNEKYFYDSLEELKANTNNKTISNNVDEKEIKVFEPMFGELINEELNSLFETRRLSKSEKLNTKPDKITEQVFQTKFTDKNLLIETLNSLGLDCEEHQNQIICRTDDYIIIFTKGSENFEFKITGNISDKEAYQQYKNIDSNYEKVLQKSVVDNIKQKVKKNSNMKIEQEEILEDNSVLLTISI